jgi:hypothetical protein
MHGFMHDILCGTDRTNLVQTGRHRNEYSSRPARLAVTDVKIRFGPEQYNLTNRCPDPRLKARRPAQKTFRIIQDSM